MQDNAQSTADLSKSLESTRAHLQGQLRSKEAENNRLTVQIKVCHGLSSTRHHLSTVVVGVVYYDYAHIRLTVFSLAVVWYTTHGKAQTVIPALPYVFFVLSIGSEPGASSQSAESGDGASDRTAGEAEAAGRCRPRGPETSHASPETASWAQRGHCRPAECPAAGHGKAVPQNKEAAIHGFLTESTKKSDFYFILCFIRRSRWLMHCQQQRAGRVAIPKK